MLLSKPCKFLQQDQRCLWNGSFCDPRCTKMQYADSTEPDGPEKETLIQPLSEFICVEKRAEPSGNGVSVVRRLLHQGVSGGSAHKSRRFKERRRYPRFQIELPLEFKGPDGLLRGAVVRDISQGGLLICSIHDMPAGKELKVGVFFVDEHELDQLNGTARIIRKDRHSETDWEGYKYALEFVGTPAENRMKHERLINNHLSVEDTSGWFENR